MDVSRKNIKSFTLDELVEALTSRGLRKFRAAQIIEWIYRNHASAFSEMTNISKAERDLLDETFLLPSPRVIRVEQSSDGTRKFLFEMEDGHRIESVLIPDNDRQTLCISSQVGCQQACRFCLTGNGGFIRNLLAYEIADQVLEVSGLLAREHSRGITNIVLMGMGEPLANFDEVVKALRMITSDAGLGFSPRRVTLSTDGLVPELDRLGKTGTRVNIAISLNATTDEVRNELMPVNRRYPIKALLASCRHYPLEPRRRITFEYVMLQDVNDAGEDAQRLAILLRGIKCKINLIPFNPFPGSTFKRPDDRTVRKFQQILLDQHYATSVRESRGRDISAACGQLRESAADA